MVKNASAAGTPTRTPPEELTALPKPHSWTKCRGGLGKGKKIGWKERRDNEREMRERKMEREEKMTGEPIRGPPCSFSSSIRQCVMGRS